MQSDIKTIRKEQPSPLAEGRELKFFSSFFVAVFGLSPLAEGRELKYLLGCLRISPVCRRPSRRGVN